MAIPKQRPLFCSPAESAFREFNTANPIVYRKLVEFALQARATGRKHFGMKALFERLRWWSQVETRGDEYKLNNNYTAFYARMLMDRNPELGGFFELRRSVADEEWEA
jgi:hypothetical protein